MIFVNEKSPETGVDKNIVKYIIRDSYVAAVLLGILFYALREQLPERFAEGFFYGATCGVLNLFFLGALIRSLLGASGSNKFLAAMSFVGINVIIYFYFYAFWKLKYNQPALVAGFTIIFLVMVVEAVYRKAKKGSTG